MNNKTLHAHISTELSRQGSAPTGKDLPLFTHLVNHIKTRGSDRLIRFYSDSTQRNSLDLHLVTDQLDRHVIKVIDSDNKDVIREIPHTDLQYIMQVNLLAQCLQTKVSRSISGTEVAASIYSALEVI